MFITILFLEENPHGIKILVTSKKAIKATVLLEHFSHYVRAWKGGRGSPKNYKMTSGGGGGGHLDYLQNDDAIYEQLLTNIARIAALHKLHGTSSINVSFVCPFMNHSVTKVSIVLSVLSLVFLSRVTKCLPK